MNAATVVLILMLFSVAGGLFSGCSSSKDVPDGTLVTILYSNDVRGRIEGCGCKHNGGGITRRSAAIAAAREEDPSVLYCDAGNFMTGTPEVDSTKGAVSIAAYNRMKATVINISERELALGIDVFKEAKGKAAFDMISANLRYQGSPLAQPYSIKNVKEARVGFIGVCGTKEAMRSDSLLMPVGISIDDPVESTRRAVAALTGKVSMIVVLSTCGDKVDSLIAHSVPGIRLIIGGRTFRPNPTAPWEVNDTRIVRTMRDGRALGRLDLVFGPGNAIKTYRATEVAMESAEKSDSEMLSTIHEFIPNFVDNPGEGVRIIRN